jgi:hypothetical protein
MIGDGRVAKDGTKRMPMHQERHSILQHSRRRCSHQRKRRMPTKNRTQRGIMLISDEKQTAEAIVQMINAKYVPILSKIKNWDGEPSRLNDLRTSMKGDLQALMSQLEQEFPVVPWDSFIEILEKECLDKKDQDKDDVEALAFLTEMLLQNVRFI